MSRWRDLKDTYRNALRGDPAEVDTSRFTPKQRERYERNMAHLDQARRDIAAGQAEVEAIQQAQVDAAVLQGPALEPSKEGLLHAVKEDLLGPVVERDPAERERIAAAERAARDAARAPYRAPDPPAVTITRIATRGKTQLQELIAHLQRSGLAARPDLVHGVYRVPDRISPDVMSQSERGRVVEWAAVHHPAPLPATGDEVEVASFPRDAQLIARRAGEPSVLDEDVAGLYCALAGVAPEECLGAARVMDFREARWGQEQTEQAARVTGISVLHRPVAGGAAARERILTGGPHPVTPGQPEGFRHEVLDWAAIAHRTRPAPRHPVRVPSPLPYLPSSPEELLLAYLEVVGVRPADSYSAQVTVTSPNASVDATGSLEVYAAGPLPCADGKPRRRLHAAEHVVLAYRDRPEYASGRERWAAYLRDVLYARLSHLTGVRAPVERPPEQGIYGVFEKAGNLAYFATNPLDWLFDMSPDAEWEKRPVPFPYCWPPV